MPPDEAPLTALASSLADGGDVDWLAAESTATTPDGQACVQQLKIIANLAGAYREAAEAAFAPPAPPRTGWGPLALRGELGTGAFGTVHLAWDPSLEREVALKILCDTANAASMIEEGRLLARVRHPNVVMVHGVDEFDGAVGLWMELIDGLTLNDRLESGTMGPREAALIGIDLCSALAAVHKAGLLHRDIKPQNVMCENGGRTVLMDFGGGERKTARGDSARTRVATPLYVAPEVFRGGPATIASDIYSLGVLLYHAVTKRFPIEGDTLEDVEAAHAGRPAPLLDRRPDLPGHFARVVERAIHPDPVRRYRSAGELHQDLIEWVKDDIAQPTVVVHTPHIPLRKPSVAVLPFVNAEGADDPDYLGISLAEDLIHGLSRVDGLRVTSRIASFAPQHHRNLDPTAVCRDLRVDAVLCGTVRRRDDQLRINAELVSGADGCHIWSEGYTRQIDDLPAERAAQEEIARSVVDGMKVKLGDLARQPLIRRDTDNASALNFYRSGRYNWGKRYEGGLMTAIQEFGKAITEDAGFALPYAGLADAFAFLGFYSLGRPRDAFRKAREAAEQALRIERNLPEAHTSLGLVKLGDEWNFDAAKDEFSTALALDLDGSQVLTRVYLSWLLVLMNRPGEAMAEARRAQEAAPDAPLVNSGAGHTFYLLGRDDEAVEYCQTALKYDRECLVAIYVMGACRARQARMTEAIELLERAADGSGLTGSGRAPFFLAILGNFYARAGASDKVSAIFAELDQLKAIGRYVPPHSQAFIYAGMNDLDRAFEWQARVYEDGASPFNYFSPVIANMHGDPRHDAEKKRMGLRV